MRLKSFRTLTMLTIISAGLLAWVGCDGANDSDSPNAPPTGGPGLGGPGSPGPGRPEREGKSSPIKVIMAKLDRGPSALTKAIGNGLKSESPDWGTLQKQSSEYAGLARELGPLEPPKGSKESWAQLTASFAETAGSLDRAAQAKDRAAALKAHESLTGSCMACHREHRRMGRGGGPPGGGPPGKGGFPGGGPPPGGPPPEGGPPPGGPPPEGGPPPGGPAPKAPPQ